MDELGIDFTVLYPTNTLLTCAEEDPELRRGLCRGFNAYYADVYGPFADRMAVAGIIPMHTPEEAVAELRHCRELGLKVVCLPEGVLRPLDEPATPATRRGCSPARPTGSTASRSTACTTTTRCGRRVAISGFVVTFHGGLTVRPGLHWSITSYVANHVGQFAAEMYPLCKSLLFGGVTARFPICRSCSSSAACRGPMQMLGDTVEHWEKRNVDALGADGPGTLDREELGGYFAQYGGRLAELLGVDPYEYVQRLPIHGSMPEEPDEFVHIGVDEPADGSSASPARSTSGARPTTAASPLRSHRANPGGAGLRRVFCRPTSGTGTSPTWPASWPSPSSWSRTATSRRISGARWCSTTRWRCSAGQPRLLRRHPQIEHAVEGAAPRVTAPVARPGCNASRITLS